MSTRKQRAADRKNAQKSTGPKTDEGKQRSSQNALKHGLYAIESVIPARTPPTSTNSATSSSSVFSPMVPTNAHSFAKWPTPNGGSAASCASKPTSSKPLSKASAKSTINSIPASPNQTSPYCAAEPCKPAPSS